MRYIVVTDLDGTLLDHHTYDFTAAREAIAQLQQQNIPLILNSSKTQAEIFDIRQQLDNKEPFVCENGGILCIPNTSSDRLQIKHFGIPKEQFLDTLSKIKRELQLNYESFSNATVEDVVRWTGLAPSDARKAMKREATEPLLWHDTEEALAKFKERLRPLQLQCVRGGRFHHVMGTFHKASCFAQLREYYGSRWQEEVAIAALGDSQNDLQMLEDASFAIVIPSPKGIKIKLERDDTFYATQIAPDGWQEGIDYFLNRIRVVEASRSEMIVKHDS